MLPRAYCSHMATRRGDERDPSAVVAGAVLVCAVITVALTFVPFVRYAYRAAALPVTFDVVNGLIALLIAYLLHGRYRSGRRLQDLLLALALCTIATANLVLTALPAAAGLDSGTTDRGASVSRLVGIVLLVAGAVVSGHVVVRRGSRLPGAAVLAVPAVVGVLLAVTAPAAAPAAEPLTGSGPPLVTNPLFLAAQVLGGVLFLVATAALTVKTVRYGDELLRWLAAACAVGIFARFHYVLYPSLYSEYVYSGDLLRLGSHLLMLVGAVKVIRSHGSAGSAGRTSATSPAPPA